MNNEWNDRTLRLLGEENVNRLHEACVLVVGVGGVGGYAAEMLARTGIGNLILVDADDVADSNINRQLIATHSTVGNPKVDLFAERFHDINPGVCINVRKEFLTPDNVSTFFEGRHVDYVIDAIDTVAPKVALISHCMRNNIPIISSMGAGGRIDPTKVEYTDIWVTREDGLARAVRHRLKELGLRRTLKVVASHEKPHSRSMLHIDATNKRSSYGTIATIPAIFGIMLANHVILKFVKDF